jgi:hypothetical protein
VGIRGLSFPTYRKNNSQNAWIYGRKALPLLYEFEKDTIGFPYYLPYVHRTRV